MRAPSAPFIIGVNQWTDKDDWLSSVFLDFTHFPCLHGVCAHGDHLHWLCELCWKREKNVINDTVFVEFLDGGWKWRDEESETKDWKKSAKWQKDFPKKRVQQQRQRRDINKRKTNKRNISFKKSHHDFFRAFRMRTTKHIHWHNHHRNHTLIYINIGDRIALCEKRMK